jgi:hypothetical protein
MSADRRILIGCGNSLRGKATRHKSPNARKEQGPAALFGGAARIAAIQALFHGLPNPKSWTGAPHSKTLARLP